MIVESPKGKGVRVWPGEYYTCLVIYISRASVWRGFLNSINNINNDDDDNYDDNGNNDINNNDDSKYDDNYNDNYKYIVILVMISNM